MGGPSGGGRGPERGRPRPRHLSFSLTNCFTNFFILFLLYKLLLLFKSLLTPLFALQDVRCKIQYIICSGGRAWTRARTTATQVPLFLLHATFCFPKHCCTKLASLFASQNIALQNSDPPFCFAETPQDCLPHRVPSERGAGSPPFTFPVYPQRFRANVAHIRQSRPEHIHDSQGQILALAYPLPRLRGGLRPPCLELLPATIVRGFEAWGVGVGRSTLYTPALFSNTGVTLSCVACRLHLLSPPLSHSLSLSLSLSLSYTPTHTNTPTH